ncbi:MAG TPA: helix-turn-helix transcriptional regulator [Candidatus Paceibacterota bacterium]
MKKQSQNKKKIKKLTMHSFDAVFKKHFRSKVFQKSYDEEIVRLKFSNKIKQMRIAKQFTQKMVASRAHMPQSVIARIESGTHSFSLGTLHRIAQVFDKEVELV